MLPPMRVLILGCGTIGMLAGERLAQDGHAVTGVRRTPGEAPFPLIAADAGELALHAGLGFFDAVLLTANPGIRRGRDNGLARIARIIARNHRQARVVYTGTTSLYGDAGGAAVAEDGPLDPGPEAQALRGIETDLAQHPDALVLRATALVGPTRTHARERIRAAAGTPLAVKGDPDRPFSYLHEADLAELCVHAIGADAAGNLGTGVLNAAAPERLTVRAYYERLAQGLAMPVEVTGDGTEAPRRAIDARRLHGLLPGFPWRGID